MKNIPYIWLLCVVICACSGPDDGLPTDDDSDNGPHWYDDLDLPLADATGYPYDSSKMITATLSINSSSKMLANNLLLGTNFGNFTTADDQEIIRFLDPVTVRFPSGVWSNWYNWEDDISEYDPNDPYDIGEFHRRVMDTWALAGTKTGFPGMTELHNELNFNTLFTYNINYDTAKKSIARLRDSDAKGFDVKYIELGNELFWEDQRSSRVATPIQYYFTVKPIADSLKAEKPSLKLSVPFGWRESQAGYNAQVSLTKDYFDAISLHKYIDPEKNSESEVKSSDAYKEVLSSRIGLKESSDFVLRFAPGKPIWLTEWGVSCGLNAASFLGQADAYLYLFDNQDIYERAEWYGLTTALNPMYSFSDEILDNLGRPERSLRNMRKTGHGAVYEILRDVFEDSEILETTVSTRILAEGVNAVEAKAVTKDGKTEIFVLNKTVRSVPFRVELDGNFYEGSQKHEAMSFNSLQDNKYLSTDENPLTLVSEGTETIVLPPFSVSKITL
ncbi:hypothetical protein [Formosa sp. PL04]|uniref:hypothetical protein n=1 Tax=Formosa sp. PL04 TaxID=3081755 RepID=UPI002981FD73|nr:hypothetical protein [Formosa sp. PL04]MDW5288126.1 hypothetical protein [Formosa sp. PL04]